MKMKTLIVPVVAAIDEAAAYICREWIDEVYIDCPATDPAIAKLMDDCRFKLPPYLGFTPEEWAVPKCYDEMNV